ncbi:MAG: T9SS type A sorting domain-containing protein [Chlorobi bacterium]|nr:T9SS type A sorting domain-containing protein [Chlorobiota bacterium]
MKNILPNAILVAFAMLLFATVNTKSQGLSFELVSADQNVSVVQGQSAPKAFAVIKNIAGESKSVKVKIDKSDMHADHVVGYCWGSCFAPSAEDVDSPDAITLEPGASSGEEDFDLLLAPVDWMDGVTDIKAGTSVFHIEFYDANNPLDNLMFDMTFVVQETGVEDGQPKITVTITPAIPNPTSEMVSLNYTIPAAVANGTLNIYDVNGNLIESVNVSSADNSYNFDTSVLATGKYFYGITVEGQASEMKSFVVAR